MNKPQTDKYEIIENDVVRLFGRKLYRIRALRNIPDHADKGDIGGYVGGPNCLSQEGNCWIYPSARVFNNAEVLDDAVVAGHSVAYGSATIKGRAVLAGNAQAIGRVLLANDERLDRDRMLANVLVLQCGQFVQAGYTTFTFKYRADGIEADLGIGVTGCTTATAMTLSLYKEGFGLATYLGADGEVRLFSVPGENGFLEYAEVLKSLS